MLVAGLLAFATRRRPALLVAALLAFATRRRPALLVAAPLAFATRRRPALLVAALLALAAPARAEVDYRVDLSERARQQVQVELTISGASGPIALSMPVWTPGAYELRTWGRNVTPIDARDGAGRPLAIARSGPSSFRVAAGTAPLRVRYRVYAARLSDDGSHVDASHALLNGSSIFLAVAGQERAPQRVHVALPDGWRAISALPDATGGGWQAASYEALIDAPIECGHFVTGRARALERDFTVAIDGPADAAQATRLAGDLARLATSEAGFAGAPPYRRYLALIHLADEPGHVAALEHAAATSILVPRRAFVDAAGYDELVYVVAHELFHAWNARLLRPAELVPYDLSRPQPSRALWITEGLTEYYAHRAMRRAGRWTRAQYLQRLGEEAGRAVAAAGDGALSLEDAAQATWQPPDDAGGEPDGYYARGHLVALALDAAVRHASGGAHTLDDAVRALCADATAAGGLLAVDSERLARAIERLAPGVGALVLDWARAGDETARLAPALAGLGLTLELHRSPPRAAAGFSASRDGRELLVEELTPAGAATLAGLRAGDRIVSFDGATPPARWPEAIAARTPGSRLQLGVLRADEPLVLRLTLQSHREVTATIALAAASPAVTRLRDAWLDP